MRFDPTEDSTPAARHAGEPGPEQAPTIWFEVENLLRYFDHFSNPQGIQRVSLEILAAAEKEHGRTGRVRFCRLSLYTGRFQQIGFDQILAAYSSGSEIKTPWSLIPLLGSRRIWRKMLATLVSLPSYLFRISAPFVQDLLRGRNSECEQRLVSGDVLVCLGGSWLTRGYSGYIAELKRKRGVHFVQLVHDVIPIFQPQWTPFFGRTFGRWLNQIARVTDLFLTISCSAQHDLLRIAAARRIAIPQVEVIRYGSGFLPRRLPSNGANQNGVESLPARYVLCVSTLELRKNHRLLLAVWQRLIRRHGADAVPTLVLVGRAGYFILDSGSLLAKLAACGYLGGKIVLMSDLSDRVLVEVYRRCLFTVYPSLYEGWGLPVAESMAHGKFCVASNGGAIPEVGGELVDYFDPTNEDDALAKIERPLLDSNYLAEKESQIQARYRPATWSDCAHEMVAKVGYLSNPCSGRLRANCQAESGSRL